MDCAAAMKLCLNSAFPVAMMPSRLQMKVVMRRRIVLQPFDQKIG
jgi:hypothetical protein